MAAGDIYADGFKRTSDGALYVTFDGSVVPSLDSGVILGPATKVLLKSDTSGGLLARDASDSAAAPITGSVITGTRFVSTIATGTAPLTVSSTTNVANLNASSLGGATFAAPGAIGSGTPSTIAGTTITGTALTGTTSVGAQGANGQSLVLKQLTELTTIAAAPTTDTVIQMPAASIVLAVSVRVTVVIPTATNFTVGDSGSAARFSTAAVSVAATSTDPGTKAGAYYNASALSVRITPDGTPAANTGRVRVTIYYLESAPPTS